MTFGSLGLPVCDFRRKLYISMGETWLQILPGMCDTFLVDPDFMGLHGYSCQSWQVPPWWAVHCRYLAKGQKLGMLFIPDLSFSCWELAYHQRWLLLFPMGKTIFGPKYLGASVPWNDLHFLTLKVLLACWLPFSYRPVARWPVYDPCWEKCLLLPEQLTYLLGSIFVQLLLYLYV